MKKRWILLSVLLFSIFGNLNAKEEEEYRLDQPNSCSFFCFILPKWNESVSESIEAVKTLNCTHVVYGYAQVDKYKQLINPNFDDFPLSKYFNNFRKLHELHKRNPPIQLLLGIREELGIHFTDSISSRNEVIKNIMEKAENHYFDGIFLNLRDTNFLSFNFEYVIGKLHDEMETRSVVKHNAEKKMSLVVALSPKDVLYAHHKLKEYVDKVDLFYLKSDEAISNDRSAVAIAVDPLYEDPYIAPHDTIRFISQRLQEADIPAEKIIVGLSSWARGYQLEDENSTSAGSAIRNLPKTRFSYQDVCNLTRKSIDYSKKSSVLSFTTPDGHWYSLNEPNHTVAERKVEFISTHGFCGIGLVQMEADDPKGVCGNGPYPLHRYVSENFRCTRQHAVHGGTAECRRLCVYRPEHGVIDLKTLDPSWCSHVVISSLGFDESGSLMFSAGQQRAIDEFTRWKISPKPFLVLSVGAEESGEQWQKMLATDVSRSALIRSLNQRVVDGNIDGVNVEFVKDQINGSTIGHFSDFIGELRRTMPKSQLFVTVTPISVYNDGYDMEKLQRDADFVIAEGYTFHNPKQTLTGHHSPLFSDPLSDLDLNKSVDTLAHEIVSQGINRTKLIIGYSAVGLVMSIIRSEEISPEESWIRREVDLNDFRTDRADSSGYITPVELCADMKGQNFRRQFVSSLGVPIGMKDGEFYAYDDEHSIQMKSIWTSLNRFGGISIHGIESDNPTGSCPEGRPFPLLQAIAKTQSCQKCLAKTKVPKEESKCRSSDFQVICVYRLPQNDTEFALDPKFVAFDLCSELVVEESFWEPNGDLTLRDEAAEQNLRELGSKTEKITLTASIRCNMTSDELKTLLGSGGLSLRITEFLTKYKFNGVEFRCDDVLTEEMQSEFSQLLKEIQNSKSENLNDCPNVVGIRVPVRNQDPTQHYSVETINSIDRIILEPFEANAQKRHLFNPLYHFQVNNLSADSTIQEWIRKGIEPSKIVMQIPAYGIVQNFGNTTDDSNDYMVVSQRQICQEYGSKKTHMMYDVVSNYATTTGGQWISYETQSTITYKVHYAQRQGLGGVGLIAINEDDFTNSCKNHRYPLLNAIHSSLCKK